LSFVNGCGFCKCFLENSNKGIEVLLSVLRHDTDSESGLSDFDNWILNSVNMDT
jgi:hypothetical protein